MLEVKKIKVFILPLLELVLLCVYIVARLYKNIQKKLYYQYLLLLGQRLKYFFPRIL